MTYQVFTRTWWIKNDSYPDGLEPGPGRKHVIGYVATQEEARAMCEEYNSTHKPGRLSKKAEYTSDF